jgi:hypothetical protein
MIRRRIHCGIEGRTRSIKLYLSKTKRTLAAMAL